MLYANVLYDVNQRIDKFQYYRWFDRIHYVVTVLDLIRESCHTFLNADGHVNNYIIDIDYNWVGGWMGTWVYDIKIIVNNSETIEFSYEYTKGKLQIYAQS